MNPAMSGIVANPLLHLIIKAGTLLLFILVSLIVETRVPRSGSTFCCILITLCLFVIVSNTFLLIPHFVG